MKSFFKSPVFLGGLAGALNGWLCYARIPFPVEDWNQFKLHIILAGAAHGACLAACVRLFSVLCYGKGFRAQAWGLVLSGYVAGWLSFIPIRWSNGDKNWDFGAFVWPMDSGGLAFLWVPIIYFGLVVTLYYSLLVLWKRLYSKDLRFHLMAGVASGVLGSLWWWISWKPWTLCLIHGPIWGLATGLGMWFLANEKQSRPPE